MYSKRFHSNPETSLKHFKILLITYIFKFSLVNKHNIINILEHTNTNVSLTHIYTF